MFKISQILIVLIVLRLTLLVNNSYYNLFFGFILFTWATALIIKSDAIQERLLGPFVAVALSLAIGWLSLFLSEEVDINQAIKDTGRIITLVCIFFITLQYSKRWSKHLLETAIFAVVVVIFLFDTWFYIKGEGKYIGDDFRFSGIYDQIGIYGTFLSSLILCLFGCLRWQMNYLRWISAALMLVLLFLLALNNTLKAIVSLCIALLAFLYFDERKIKWIPFYILIALVLFIFNANVLDRMSDYSMDTFFFSNNHNPVSENSFQWRIMHWSLLLEETALESPYLGIGIGGARLLDNGFVADDGYLFMPHSDLVRFIVEFGFLGFMLPIFIISILLLKLRKIWLRSDDFRSFTPLIYYFFLNGLLGSVLFTTSSYLLAFIAAASLGIISGRQDNFMK